MEKPLLHLEPGQKAVAIVSEGLCFTIVHDGWGLQVMSSKPIAVRPKNENTIQVIAFGSLSGVETETQTEEEKR